MTDKLVHQLRPGPLRGTQVLCEDPKARKRGDYFAEYSARGMGQITCEDCLLVMREIDQLLRYLRGSFAQKMEDALQTIMDMGHDVSCQIYEGGLYPVGTCNCHCAVAAIAVMLLRREVKEPPTEYCNRCGGLLDRTLHNLPKDTGLCGNCYNIDKSMEVTEA